MLQKRIKTTKFFNSHKNQIMTIATIILMTPSSGGASGSGGMGGYTNIIFLVAIFAVMYFFLIRPQAKKAKDQKNFMSSLQKGDKIVTIGGIHGRISRVIETNFEVEIDTNTKVILEKAAVSLEYTKAIRDVKSEDAK
jgi:preprotein translocase subunit YajC